MTSSISLGRSDRSVSPVCIGTYTLAGAWAGDLDSAKRALRYGIENGLTFFDTAHVYGRAESVLGEVLATDFAEDRDSLTICSKAGLDVRPSEQSDRPFIANSRPEFLRSCLVTSLERMGLERLDVFLVHWFDPDVPLPEVAGALRSYVDEGLVRAVGVSNYPLEALVRMQDLGSLDVIQVPYSLLSRDIDADVLPFALDHGVGVMGYAALAQGYLTGQFEMEPRFAPKDFRSRSSDFSGDDYRARVGAVEKLRALATARGCSVAEFAMAWVMAATEGAVIPLVGVQAPSHVDSVLTALGTRLGAPEVRAAAELFTDVPPMDFRTLVS